jgi:thiol:disulfide interchange protein
MARDSFGWFGWVSAAGFIILGALYLIDEFVAEVWAVSQELTLAVAIVAGIGALLLYYGEDPTDEDRRDTTP